VSLTEDIPCCNQLQLEILQAFGRFFLTDFLVIDVAEWNAAFLNCISCSATHLLLLLSGLRVYAGHFRFPIFLFSRC
jgi:hypothetical protein